MQLKKNLCTCNIKEICYTTLQCLHLKSAALTAHFNTAHT